MEERINVAEILKDCPTGMELDCTMFYNAYLERVYENGEFPIVIKVGKTELQRLTEEGCWNKYSNAKCVIFPKGKTTWEGFHRPFKNGDIVFYNNTIAIFKEWGDKTLFRTYCVLYTTVSDPTYQFEISRPLFGKGIHKEVRLATEEEKAKLFQAIKDNGYKWNSNTKTLEKLVEPKFKVGDRIRKKGDYISGFITLIDSDNFYKVEYGDGGVSYANVKSQDDWELVPNKFDISTLVPFESRVLVRDSNIAGWKPSFWGLLLDSGRFETVRGVYNQCIPYKGNEHLMGKIDDCDDFYKNWKE